MLTPPATASPQHPLLPLATHLTDYQRLVLYNGALYESKDLGDTWNSSLAGIAIYNPTPAVSPDNIGRVLVYGHKFDSELLILASLTGLFWRSGPSNPSFPSVNFPASNAPQYSSNGLADPTKRIIAVTVDPLVITRWYILFSTSLQLSDSGGNPSMTFTDAAAPLPLGYLETCTALVALFDRIFIGTTQRLRFAFLLKDASGSPVFNWQAIDGFPVVRVMDLQHNAQRDVLAIATLGRGAWRISDAATVPSPLYTVSVPWQPRHSTTPLGNSGQELNYFAPSYRVTVGGAVNVVLPDPNDASGATLWAATVNGGVWKTTTANSPSISWTPVSDTWPSLSTADIAMHLASANTFDSNVLVVAIGRWSNYYQQGGDNIGLMRSTDGGLHWNLITSIVFRGANSPQLRRVLSRQPSASSTPQQHVIVTGGSVVFETFSSQSHPFEQLNPFKLTSCCDAAFGGSYCAHTHTLHMHTHIHTYTQHTYTHAHAHKKGALKNCVHALTWLQNRVCEIAGISELPNDVPGHVVVRAAKRPCMYRSPNSGVDWSTAGNWPTCNVDALVGPPSQPGTLYAYASGCAAPGVSGLRHVVQNSPFCRLILVN